MDSTLFIVQRLEISFAPTVSAIQISRDRHSTDVQGVSDFAIREPLFFQLDSPLRQGFRGSRFSAFVNTALLRYFYSNSLSLTTSFLFHFRNAQAVQHSAMVRWVPRHLEYSLRLDYGPAPSPVKHRMHSVGRTYLIRIAYLHSRYSSLRYSR